MGAMPPRHIGAWGTEHRNTHAPRAHALHIEGELIIDFEITKTKQWEK